MPKNVNKSVRKLKFDDSLALFFDQFPVGFSPPGLISEPLMRMAEVYQYPLLPAALSPLVCPPLVHKTLIIVAISPVFIWDQI